VDFTDCDSGHSGGAVDLHWQGAALIEVRQRQLDDVNDVMQENLAGMRVVKAFVQSEYENRRFDRANRSLQPSQPAPDELCDDFAAVAGVDYQPVHGHCALVWGSGADRGRR
jgi:ABC-type multidrug transport system fused ATPase/permease subunit